MNKPLGYTWTQIALHWGIATIILGQFLFNDGMGDAFDKVEAGQVVATSGFALGHVIGGVAVLLLTIWRITVKIKRGSPALPDEESKLQKIAAHATHGLLYLCLLLVPLSGMAAWFGGSSAAAEGHEVLTTLLLVLIALHFGAALYHRFILKSGVMERMLRAK